MDNKQGKQGADKKVGMQKLRCGLIMPISAIDGCSAEHWGEVKSIVTDSITSIDSLAFEVKLVSDSDDVGVIQKRIVQNLYDSEIVICDVSGKNPNVMFELGMRLAFDKPTILIKDDKTDYIFDTGVIEHITYPRDLRFSRIVDFKEDLKRKLLATYKKSLEPNSDSSFLKNFGKFTVATLKEDVVSADKAVIEMMSELQSEVSMIRRRLNYDEPNFLRYSKRRLPPFVSERLKDLILSWVKKNGYMSPLELVENPDFIGYLESSIQVKEIFSGKAELMHFIKMELAENGFDPPRHP